MIMVLKNFDIILKHIILRFFFSLKDLKDYFGTSFFIFPILSVLHDFVFPFSFIGSKYAKIKYKKGNSIAENFYC